MKANKKKIIILVSLVLLLVATGVLNYFITIRNKPNDPSDVDATPTFFSSFRDDRENTRAQEILYLDDIITNANSDETTIASAQSKKLTLVDTMETELTLEGLIKAKGFEDCVVTISSEKVNVVVMDSELTIEEAAQILDIIVQQTKYTAKNVIILPYV
ncbi:MAG TPA: SpoIIIAH-like family protein [Clostridia bacterium]|nr:SpoIIIAH-like family protein [Clostridia bacterium]